jgi:hypothetical protein
VCRFVIDLFDKKVMRQIVLEEDVDDLDDAVITDEEDEDGGLFDDDDNEEEGDQENRDGGFGGRLRSDSERSQMLTDEEDAALFGEREERGLGLGRGLDMSGTTILRGAG